MSIPGNQTQTPGLLNDPSARTLVAGDLEAIFLPGHGMLGASLRRSGVEILRRVNDLDVAATNGSTAGIPLLYPWANRLAEPRYRAAGKEVSLDLASPFLHLDASGLPMHGVPWSLLVWKLTKQRRDFLAAQLDWTRSELLNVFPFPHRLEMSATVSADSLTIETIVVAGRDGPVPVSFGFHPYFGLPDLPRTQWRLELPAMRKLVLDPRGIPTGRDEPFDELETELGESNFDDGFTLLEEQASFTVAGAGRRITVEFLSGYSYLQIYAPKDKDYIALEPMTAPTSALTNGQRLRLVKADEQFRAAFRIGVDVIKTG